MPFGIHAESPLHIRQRLGLGGRVPPDVVKNGMAFFQEKYNTNEMAVCGSCYTDECHVRAFRLRAISRVAITELQFFVNAKL